tara:strand:+ start:2600 stop:3202 length:603 start_codon:yes stop_codon:yes gene_type:complete
MDPINYFKENSYVHVPGLVPPDLTNFIYNYLIIKACTNIEFDDGDTSQDRFVRYCYGDTAIETLSSVLLEKISYVTEKKLCPTYSYCRVYTRGEKLKPHTDRPSCEYSMTINFGGDPWPIYFGEFNKDQDLDNGYQIKNQIALNPGDGIIYMGEKLVHWRNKFLGDHCAQAFLHYIDTEGLHYPEHAYDGRINIGYKQAK